MDQDDLVDRVNRTLNRKDFLNGIFAYRNIRGTTPNIFDFVDGTNTSGINSVANWRHMFNQRVNSTFGVQYGNFRCAILPILQTARTFPGKPALPATIEEPIDWGPPTLNFAGSNTAGLQDSPQVL